MGLIDTIRKAEERSREAARRGLDRARTGWHDRGRTLRRKMRLNWPGQKPAVVAPADGKPTPIVSVNGKDVWKGGRRIA